MALASRSVICTDVTRTIFEFLDPGCKPLDRGRPTSPLAETQRRMSRSTLSSAALTCRAFSGPALDILWRVVDHPMHLLSLFPSFGQHPKPRDHRFHATITDAEWLRFREYARRVRILTFTQTDHPRIHPSVWFVLATRCEGEPFLPSLRTLLAFSTSHSATEGLAEIDVLYSSTLRHLELDTCESDSHTSHVFADEVWPVLTQLDVLRIRDIETHLEDTGGLPYWELHQLQVLEVAHGIVPTVSLVESHRLRTPHNEGPGFLFGGGPGWSPKWGLTRVSAEEVNPGRGETLMNFPGLRSLSLVLKTRGSDAVPLAAEKLTGNFTALHNLVLEGGMHDIGDVLEGLSGRAPNLQSISLQTIHLAAWTQEEVMKLKRIYALLETYTIHDFRLTIGQRLLAELLYEHYHNTNLATAHVSEFLAPLCSKKWCSLQTITLVSYLRGTFAYISDGDLRALVDVCPGLLVFEFIYHINFVKEINGGRMWSKMQGASTALDEAPTLSTIVAFAAAHPHLQRLSLPLFSLRSIPAPKAVSIGHKLKSFDVAVLQKGTSLYPAALVLDRAFPELELWDSPEVEYALRGNELRQLLFGIQAGRRSVQYPSD
ncbi:hypothetical protein C8Q80DRAFT_1351676 [Daedaleopsis nitida]|nr:hypothetical protein C8Q80DRAFT_1351676 [Daedaleopsis nitida]